MQDPMVCMVATPKSHPFEERRIKVGPETDPIKIGRAVARTQPTEENAVFDCKVLSRNHAIVWYNKGSFYIRDTKSSNGTFVNNEKLLSQGKDTDARKVYSGDIIQLGVEIVENTNKVAYGCIYAVIQCYNEEGKLVAGGPADDCAGFKNGGTLCSDRKLFQMQQYLSEAIYREKLREDKIAELMSIIEANEQAAETAWKSLVNEDRLLARIEALEAQLTVSTNNNDVDKLKEDSLLMIDEKTKFEAMTKDTIRRLQEDNGELTSRLKDMERSLDNTETTCNQLRSTNADLENILADTTEQNSQQQYDLMNEETYRIQVEEELASTKKKLQETQQKLLALSKTSVENETATSLSRLLANALNGGSIIAQQELTLLIDSLSNANYLPSDRSMSSSGNDSSVNAEPSEREEKLIVENEFMKSLIDDENDARKQEDYLKDILELQAKNRELETNLERVNQLNMLLQMKSEKTDIEEFLMNYKVGNVEKTGESIKTSDNANQISKYPTDGLAQFSFLVSLAPLFALFLSLFVPINNRLFKNNSKQVEEHQKSK